jgi:phosphoribosylaminoimidazole-succinocarboxamide synthase
MLPQTPAFDILSTVLSDTDQTGIVLVGGIRSSLSEESFHVRSVVGYAVRHYKRFAVLEADSGLVSEACSTLADGKPIAASEKMTHAKRIVQLMDQITAPGSVGMRVLVVGGGGREHSIAWKLAQSASVGHVFVAPGNGGTQGEGDGIVSNVQIAEDDHEGLVKFAAEKNVALVVVGPETPLVAGLGDKMRGAGVHCFGPSAAAAQLEASKSFAKRFMDECGVRTAQYQTFQETEYEEARAWLTATEFPVVIKASGLAAGKGVLLPKGKDEALRNLHDVMISKQFGGAGSEVVIEERLEGEEVSLLAFTDGETVVAMPAAQDHKRAFDGDLGPNTGGMGAYAPAPALTRELRAEAEAQLLAVVRAMALNGTPYCGVLYAGLMLTKDGPSVLEYNCRFGDPEAQVLLPLLDSDLFDIMMACAAPFTSAVPSHSKQAPLKELDIRWRSGSAATVVSVSAGYPGAYAKGKEIEGVVEANAFPSAHCFHAGTKTVASSDGASESLVTSGGRVLAVSAWRDDLDLAITAAYAAADKVGFEGLQRRSDIGWRALTSTTTAAPMTYAAAGVDIDAGNALIELIKPHCKRTIRSGCDADLGGFGGVFDLGAAGFGSNNEDTGDDVLLIGCTDGVGTKLRVACIAGQHHTVGIDLVAMCVNDLVVAGAEPLFFLDYFATSKLDVHVAAAVVSGIAEGCVQAGCGLIGGETAEMPQMYEPGDYDLAGFAVGACRRRSILPDMTAMRPGDVVLALPSAGLHSNGFSLVRRLVENAGMDYSQPPPYFSDQQTLGADLLVPTRIYVRQLLPALQSGRVLGLAHITGGGLSENIPRVLPSHLRARLQLDTWKLPPSFVWLRDAGALQDEELLRTFNCGVGMVIVCHADDLDLVRGSLGSDAFQIGVLEDRPVQRVEDEAPQVVFEGELEGATQQMKVAAGDGAAQPPALLDGAIARAHSQEYFGSICRALRGDIVDGASCVLTKTNISSEVLEEIAAAGHCDRLQQTRTWSKVEGKVRDVYSSEDVVVLVSTDRQSAFDRHLASVPFKGRVLNLTSAWWFKQTEHIIPNHLLGVPHPAVSVVRKCEVFSIEFVVRGYITGSTDTSMWTHYARGERLYCGHSLPDGMRKNQKLGHPLCTPTTKDIEHDEPLSGAEAVAQGRLTAAEWEECEAKVLQLFVFGQETAATCGLILVDTKYELGRDADGKIVLVDEIHTPDSSRYWLAHSYEARFHASPPREPENIDKEFLRLWFRNHCDPYKDEQLPAAPSELVAELACRYIVLYEVITGERAPFSVGACGAVNWGTAFD